MSRRMRWGCSAGCISRAMWFSLVLFACFPFGCAKSPVVESRTTATDPAETDPAFIVPNATPAEILAFVRGLADRRPKFTSDEERVAYVEKLHRAQHHADAQARRTG